MKKANEQKKNRLGEEVFNYQKCLMKIVEYNKHNDIVVEFQDEYKCKVRTRYKLFLEGKIKNPYYPSVFKIGIIGNKYPVKIDGKISKEYNTWNGMLRRCYDKKYQSNKPTYQNVTCCKEWLCFENFYEWLHSQENFDKWYNGDLWAIDKDIIVKGNKVYSPETCCLVPPNINSLFIKCNAVRGNLPIAVQRHGKKYRACFTLFNKYTILPVKDTKEKAFLDYKIIKENAIRQVAQEEYNNGIITKECYNAMMKYEVEIDD